ncbi:uncharacterized protein PHALS_11812 [Plasmopara halstedii]|uniref:Uncharacterized protein n=1 Tax=Plasmopara halstedii TaxID=4781 RepID=A0A0P1AKB9_PLAHL|nr:uncharacterized protein PHALS_11812 [Plasmopara halstedii]CEG41469.1 hypothetical protein PHALS_11812 [Plasmopara halstedii]|eukprot:XP_024577838.1 hypothetical protein PHALS_11812 [Plasmopara halstedii]
MYSKKTDLRDPDVTVAAAITSVSGFSFQHETLCKQSSVQSKPIEGWEELFGVEKSTQRWTFEPLRSWEGYLLAESAGSTF